MSKTLILKDGNDINTIRNTSICDIENYYKCTSNNIFFRILKKLKSKLIIILFEKWKKNLKEYDTIILFDVGYNKLLTKYIKSKNPNCKIILWFWNIMIPYTKKWLTDKNIDEIYTYDLGDAKKYNLKYNTQFYNKNIKLKNKEINNDIIFLGKNKGRKDLILKYEKEFNKNNVKTNFIIIEKEEDQLKYEEYLDLVSESRAILDIVNNDVKGLTLRCMESIFFSKKLITNNKDLKNYDFYNSNNIFILEEDNIEDINSFINKPYEKIDEEIVNYYDFEQWLKRFGE